MSKYCVFYCEHCKHANLTTATVRLRCFYCHKTTAASKAYYYGKNLSMREAQAGHKELNRRIKHGWNP